MPFSVTGRCAPVRPTTPLPRRGMAVWAIATVAFFAAVGGLPRSWTGVAGGLGSLLVTAVILGAVTAVARRNLDRWLTAPYVLAVLAAVVGDVALFRHGSVPAVLVGLLPAAAGLWSWSRRGGGTR
ncbi:hypothetical protein AB0I55_08570 [Actinocatenispora sera]|uniref:Uncharacterized protein n=1 Tax=Actinocatenispora sera TaxID=390989 RepID=A0A810KTU7_9ACTN|nr:hypothetical protein [Actinocatenispora sera]BCJ26065.1 hypothetical protein Asera_01730 [Actinocatenispora sera]